MPEADNPEKPGPEKPVEFSFSLDGYRALLRWFLAQGYQVVDYREADPAARHLILRHDIDMSPALALPMAEAEAELGVCATYFTLVRSALYNPLEPRHLNSLKRAARLGHRIGLHFDAALYGEDPHELETMAAWEKDLLAAGLGQPVESVSFHRPAPGLLGSQPRIAGMTNSYAPAYFKEMGYCADSTGAWRFGPPWLHPAVQAGCALHLVTHPIWWPPEKGGEPQDVLDRYVNSSVEHFTAELSRNCKSYRRPGQ